MIQIEDKIISTELFDTDFICDLGKCRGSCCVYGDAGAPLEEKESFILEKEYENIKHYLSPAGIESIDQQGKWLVDKDDGEKVTPLINGKECAYTVFENGIAFCGIERAYNAGSTKFQKPSSCHLYPIRVSILGEYTVLNYHRWNICEPARILGKQSQMPVFRFLKSSIERVFGEVFYNEMEVAFKEIISQEPDSF
jgi:hypothetical protein